MEEFGWVFLVVGGFYVMVCYGTISTHTVAMCCRDTNYCE